MTKSLWIFGLTSLWTAFAPAQVRISEFLAENDSGLLDIDGDESDWLELENTTAAAVNLDGWYLTDELARPTKWRIPAVTLNAGGRLVVFCSLKNRTSPVNELHTNFNLSNTGEYLALVMPDGLTKATEFNPYPAQRADFSYGIARSVVEDSLITPNTASRWMVPGNNTLGATWTQPTFGDSSWTATTASVGYQTSASGPTPQAVWSFDDTNLDDITGLAANLNGAAYVTSVPTAVGSGKALQITSADREYVDVIIDVSETNYTSTFWFKTASANAGLYCVVDGVEGSGGHDRHLYLTNGNIGARTWNTETITSTGKAYGDNQWHHVAHVFGGTQGGQKIYVDGVLVASGTKAASDFNWQKRVHLGFSNDASSQFLNGFLDDFAIFNTALTAAQVQTLASGVRPVALSGVAPYTVTNVASSLRTVNTSGYLRVPFTLPKPPMDYEELIFRARYDDGFALYLNGSEIARRNAPSTPLVYNSAATSDRPITAAITSEEIDLFAFRHLLQPSGNVLAVQALNDTANSNEFLFAPQLIARDVQQNAARFMAPPTPGGANNSGYAGFVADVTFSAKRGWYTAPVSPVVACATPGATLIYTTNGSAPSLTNGTQVSSPNGTTGPSATLPISSTTTLRVNAFKPDHFSGPPDTQTYIFKNLVRNQTGAGQPTSWAGVTADYAVDPNIVNTTLAGYSFEDAITSLPTLSIVGANADIFEAPSGIYYDTQQRGLASEKRVSVEFFDPTAASTEQWQVEAGIRSHGNSSRSHGFTTKHPFRLYFRRSYGDAKLNERVFPDSRIASFDRLQLRAASTDSWPVVDGPPRWVNEKGTYLRDAHMRQAMRDLGHASGHSRFVQLFFNGLYWGLHELTERPEESFCESYFGGIADEYDVIKDFAELSSGNMAAWNALMALANNNTLTSDAGYWQVQGRNPDGSVSPSAEPLLHMASFIDYMILHIAGGAEDWPDHNYWAARRRGPLSDGFHFIPWDQEISYDNTTRTGSHIWPNTFEYVNAANSPAILYDRLRQGNAFKQRFRNRVHELYFNGGLLTPANSRARWGSLQAIIDKAMVGESARWGDNKQTPAFKRETTWLSEMNFMQAPVTGFWDLMHPTQIQRFRNAGLYPTVSQPSLSLPGGITPTGSGLVLDSTVGTIYYTTDGSDPLGANGQPSAAAQVFISGLVNSPLIAKNANWSYWVTSAALGAAWKNTSFNDASWPTGNGQLGYGDGDEGQVIGFGSSTTNRNMTTYFRKSIQVANPSTITTLKLKLLRDDGAVVYLNGTEVLRSNMPTTGTIAYATTALSNVGGADESTFYYEHTIPANLLVTGKNVVAVEVHKVSASEDDLSFDLALDATVQTGVTPIPLTTTQTVKARVLSGTEWSGMNAARYFVDTVPATAANTSITEVHYHPQNPTRPAENAISTNQDDYEFLEVQNTGSLPSDFVGVKFSGGIEFDFSSALATTLAPGARWLVVRNAAAMQARYRSPLPIVGQFASGTSLANGGELITLTDATNTAIRSFFYDDLAPWPTAADGQGPSLELTGSDPTIPAHWRASYDIGGTPGLASNAQSLDRWLDLYLDATAPNRGPLADADGDGFDNITEFLLGSHPSDAETRPTFEVARQGQTLEVTYQRRPALAGQAVTLQISTTLATWQAANSTLLDATTLADGTILETVSLTPPTNAERVFLRIAVGN
jgi:hypothetical protein